MASCASVEIASRVEEFVTRPDRRQEAATPAGQASVAHWKTIGELESALLTILRSYMVVETSRSKKT